MRHNVTSQRSDSALSLRAWMRRAAICGVAACGLGLGSGCERTPDPCVDFKLACLALTVEDGPPGIRRLSVFIDDGLVQYTQATPMKPPKTALVYPLRFGVRFGEFDNAYRGLVRVVCASYCTRRCGRHLVSRRRWHRVGAVCGIGNVTRSVPRCRYTKLC